MATTAIDTLRYARRLKEAGVPPDQAEAMADAIGSELVDQLATKDSVEKSMSALRTRLEVTIRSTVAALDSKVTALDSKVTALDSKVAALDSKVTDVESKVDRNKTSSDGEFRLLHWMVGFTLAFVVAIALALLFGDG